MVVRCGSSWPGASNLQGRPAQRSFAERPSDGDLGALARHCDPQRHGRRPPVTQERIQPGAEFTYDFVAPDHGTYWYHSHSGLQADRGLFGALVVEDPNDRTGADEDVVIVIDDWLDGLGTTPDAVLRALSPDVQGGHHGHGGAPPEVDDAEIDSAAELLASGHGNSEALGGMATHITYPLHLINGRPVEDPFVVSATAGTRLRLRVINAGRRLRTVSRSPGTR